MNTTITFKTPKKLRDEAKKAAKELGIPLSTYMNAMLSQLVRERMVTLSAYPTPRPEKIAEWEKISDDMDAHPGKYPAYTVEELISKWDRER
ncbi:MAG: RelB antitoxin [Candidatus Parcubacteria bacterium]|jgi:antitoxin component of RelBE/YafQ-DinJ toxin-antitoxin module